MAKVTKVYGPPGTGKTSWLLNKLKETVGGGEIGIRDVMFVSYSKSAVNEICDRIGIPGGSSAAPYFRTLHGLCLSWLVRSDAELKSVIGEMKEDGFVEYYRAKFCEALGIPYERGEYADTLGNAIFAAWTRTVGEFYPKKRDVQACLDILHGVNEDYATVIEKWLKAKERVGIVDYEDMLIEAFEGDISIDAKVGFVDEAQDFNRLEFEIIEKLTENLETVYFAGDDDQAIYSWKGAKPELFLNLEGEEVILPRSWRVPSGIWRFAERVIGRVKKRRAKRIDPARGGGVVRILDGMSLEDLVRLSIRVSARYPSETVFLLFRTNGMVYLAEQVLLSCRVPFRKLKGLSIWDRELLTAWNVVAKLRMGAELSFPERCWLVKNLKEIVLPSRLKAEVLEALSKGRLPLNFVEVLHSIGDPANAINFRSRKTAEIVRSARHPIEPENVNLYVDTIHAAKGRECDIAILADAITPNIASSLRSGFRDAELRVFYVGVTRARKAVLIAPLYKFKSFLTSEVFVYA